MMLTNNELKMGLLDDFHRLNEKFVKQAMDAWSGGGLLPCFVKLYLLIKWKEYTSGN